MSKSHKKYNKKPAEIQQIAQANQVAKLSDFDLEVDAKDAIQQIMTASSQEELERAVALFNISQKKKNTAREVALSGLLDKIIAQATERFEKRSAELTNKDILDYLAATSAQLDRTHKVINEVSDKPAITVNQQKNEVNINVIPGVADDRESRTRIADAALNILKAIEAAQKGENNSSLEEPVEVETVQVKEDENK